MNNADLIGKTYQNGPDGDLYKVVEVADDRFVVGEHTVSHTKVSALADFVRLSIVIDQ